MQISLQVQNHQSSLSVMRLRMKLSLLALISEQDAGKQILCQAEQRLKSCHSSRRLVHISQTRIIPNSQNQLHASLLQVMLFHLPAYKLAKLTTWVFQATTRSESFQPSTAQHIIYRLLRRAVFAIRIL